MKKQLIVLSSSGLLILLFVLGVYIYKSQQAKKYGFMARENASTFVRQYSQTLGSDDAKVYLVKFSDPACETCAAFHPFVKKLMAILEAAKRQGKYWETLDIMYKTQRYWASHHNPQPQRIWRFLPRAGLDLQKIRSDMKDPEIVKIIQQDLADAKTLNVRKTPGFFVNGKPLPRFGYKQLQELVESEVNKYY
jgi:protein-disulfide isomerase